MSKLFIFVSATFVVIFLSECLLASPQQQVPDKSKAEAAAESARETAPESLSEDMAIAKPPPLQTREPPPPPNPRYYAYHQALTFRFGKATPKSQTKLEDNVVGFQYLFPKFLAPKLEAGADLHDNAIGHITAGVRWYKWERSYFRPSVKLGGDILVDSKEKLAGLTHTDNFFARLSAALEYVVWNPYSTRLEVEYIVNHKARIAEITLGISRGW